MVAVVRVTCVCSGAGRRSRTICSPVSLKPDAIADLGIFHPCCQRGNELPAIRALNARLRCIGVVKGKS